MEDSWLSQLERPASRTDVDSRRFEDIGKVHKTDWEQRIRGSVESLPTRTPPPRRREINMKRPADTSTPEPPPPPTRATYPPNSLAISSADLVVLSTHCFTMFSLFSSDICPTDSSESLLLLSDTGGGGNSVSASLMELGG